MEMEETMKQAPMTIDFYFSMAVISIDKKFGEGYAKEHPELVSSYIQACVKDFTTVRMEGIGDELISTLSRISESIDDLVNKEIG